MKKLERHGPYTLLAPLGERSRGHTWMAQAGEGENATVVALKLALPKDAAGRTRIFHEVDLAAPLNHPHIVRLFECGEAKGVLWLSTAYVGGPHQPLKLGNFRQLLLALLHVHANELIHASLSPSRLLLDEEGDMQLCHFADARRHGEPGQAPLGPLPFMSPEQLRGEPLDVRADLFAAGAVLYQILTGMAPFSGASANAMTQLLQPGQPAPSAVAPGLGTSFDAVVAKALAREREARYASVFELLGAFDAACKRGVRPAP